MEKIVNVALILLDNALYIHVTCIMILLDNALYIHVTCFMICFVCLIVCGFSSH